ncbi:ADP-ribosyl cyclase/cyclic ADP-ribose hydrolase-like [Lineus longissimus]|uniref:ADP-ribosyl cyclase/cyclic ADP-ribose hydrolase-like n=1 Tax=Lineus longissimus TaxID=88925 RepID=UPI002B4FA228
MQLFTNLTVKSGWTMLRVQKLVTCYIYHQLIKSLIDKSRLIIAQLWKHRQIVHISMTLLSLVVLGLVGGSLGGVSPESTTASGTPRNLREIFIGRCMFYQEVVNPEAFRNGKEKNCTSLWLKFSQAWVGKDPCQVLPSSYAAFVKEAYHDLRSDKACLWSNLYSFVTDYAKRGKRVFHLALTLSGYLGDQIVWCGSTTGEGINYDNRCPGENTTTCPQEAVNSFWREVSVKYAANLNGTVKVFLDGSGPQPPYNPNSILGADEIPQLEPPRVKLVDIIVTHAIGQSARETCEKGSSIDTLKAQLNARKLEWTCHDNPPSVQHYFCIDQPNDKKCKFASSINSSTSLSMPSSYQVVSFMVLVLTIFG